MTDQLASSASQRFQSSLFEAFGVVLKEESGSSWRVAIAPELSSPADGDDSLRIGIVLDGSICGELSLEFKRSEVTALASTILVQPVAEVSQQQPEFVSRCIEKVINLLRTSLEYGDFTGKVSVDSESFANPIIGLCTSRIFTTTDDDENRLSIMMRSDSSLMKTLDLLAETTEKETTTKVVTEPAPGKENFDLVLDVELNVTLRFGRRQLTLREVFDLTSGSVIELDRQVDEPVELLLEGKVIARGEAVVIDGNYGLRVTEVPQTRNSSILGRGFTP
jgi:flagellar motor switch protein FliN